jgi:hypothetical protein
MVNQEPGGKKEINIRDLFPHLSESELKEAEENLERYLELVLRIYERIRNDPEVYARFRALTASRQIPMLNDERSNHESNSQKNS